MDKLPEFISGGLFTDERGKLSFVNDFNMQQVKRFYMIEHPNEEIVRAWQGHKLEQKWFYVVSGGFKIIVVKPDDWIDPSNKIWSTEFILSADSQGVLHIPGGYVNGFKAVGPNSQIIFSDFTVEQSKMDNYRFDKSLWSKWDV
jgi:dTDP-4-dehydrorhamnose 3,5-epimerase